MDNVSEADFMIASVLIHYPQAIFEGFGDDSPATGFANDFGISGDLFFIHESIIAGYRLNARIVLLFFISFFMLKLDFFDIFADIFCVTIKLPEAQKNTAKQKRKEKTQCKKYIGKQTKFHA